MPHPQQFGLTQKRLKRWLDYDPDTGVFIRKQLSDGRVPWGKTGYDKGRGYTHLRVEGVPYSAHRLAWLWVYGRLPDKQLDHTNGVKSDNRIANLRLATNHQNGANHKRSKKNTSGFIGVHYHPQLVNRWVARIRVNRRTIALGYHATPQMAGRAYDRAAKKYFGEFARTNESLGAFR